MTEVIEMASDEQGNALLAKIITMVCLFSISMVFGCAPMGISYKYGWFTKSDDSNIRTSNKLIVGLLSFGGGVLFAITFMHLLPEVEENVHELQGKGEIGEMPIGLAPLLMCSGFFMMYLIEELVHMYIHSREKKNRNKFSRTLSLRNSSTEAPPPDKRIKELDAHVNENCHTHVPCQGEDVIVSALRGLLIVLALSIHELFEGLAVGLESSARNVWYLFGAVSAHKYIISFCIGVEFLAAGTRKWLSIVYVFTFSFVSALGIGIGILLVGGSGATAAGIYSVVLQGIACGTLMYVVFFEIWGRNSTGLLQFACSLFGFAVMVSLEIIVEIVA